MNEHEARNRTRRVTLLVTYLRRFGYTAAYVERFDAGRWRRTGDRAGVPSPSTETIRQVIESVRALEQRDGDGDPFAGLGT